MGSRIGLVCIALALVFVLPACDGGGNGTPVVTVSGQASLMLGGNAQFSATTTNATDTAYNWATSNGLVAMVDANGMVTAQAAGTALIMATGNNSGKTGSYPVVVTAEPTEGVPFFEEWKNGPHNDQTAEAFHHWDGDGEVEADCAKCHSTPGFRDFLGADGTAAGVVDGPAEIGTTIECLACHNAAAAALTTVTFPSGVTVPNLIADKPLGKEAICMQCHQGRSYKGAVDDAIAAAGPATEDSVMPDVGFINVHYFPAGATRYGGTVEGGYLYDGKEYDVLFKHVPGLEACQDCHNPHTLEIKLDVCAGCHDVTVLDDLKDIRMISSATRDYDGDGNLVEGLYFEIDGLRTMLLQAIQAYASEVAGAAIAYDSASYPYFFNDTNSNGVVDASEASFGNRYTSFTARLLKATYNYQYSVKDPGGFAHNGKFIIQLLHDSIEDLNTQIMTPIDLSNADRTDRGHFDGTAEAFRHWDEDGDVSASCARCHSGSPGFAEYLDYKANTAQPISNGFDCAVCHTTFDTFETRKVYQVTFPGGKMTEELDDTASLAALQANICLTCHQGRTSKKDIDDLIASGGTLRFQNIHYLAAGATLFGHEAQVGYEYDDKLAENGGPGYADKFLHVGQATNTHHCVFCHSPANTEHTFLPQDNIETCRQCHTDQAGGQLLSVEDIRLNRDTDYDGDGLYPGSAMGTETLKDELHTMADALLQAMSDYAQANVGDGLIYDGNTYPYFHSATAVANAGGVASRNTGFSAWDATLLRASHNYQHSQKEPGAWAHNFYYACQLVYDSIEDLGGDVSAYTRPSTP